MRCPVCCQSFYCFWTGTTTQLTKIYKIIKWVSYISKQFKIYFSLKIYIQKDSYNRNFKLMVFWFPVIPNQGSAKGRVFPGRVYQGWAMGLGSMGFVSRDTNHGTCDWDWDWLSWDAWTLDSSETKICGTGKSQAHGAKIPGTLGTGTEILGTVPGFWALGLKFLGKKFLGLAVPSRAHPWYQGWSPSRVLRQQRTDLRGFFSLHR